MLVLDEAALLDVDLLADQGEGPNVSRAVDSEEFVSCKWGNKLLMVDLYRTFAVQTPLFSGKNPWIFRGFLGDFLITKTPACTGVKN